jgi:hypothetical protein
MRKYKHIKSINQSTNQPTSPHLEQIVRGAAWAIVKCTSETPPKKKKKKKKTNQLNHRLLGWNLNNN